MKHLRVGLVCALVCGASALAACTGTDNSGGESPPSSGIDRGSGEQNTDANGAADDQTPPQGAAAIEAWLAKGDYKKWATEPAIHESRSPSPHGYNRIYSNALLAKNAADDGAWPAGAAAVKELYAGADDDTPVGYAVYLKAQADSANGANWYWYERVPLGSMAPHDAKGVVADGLGDRGPAKTICVSCHAAAGSDGPHTPSKGGRDQVYTPVAASAAK